MPPHRWWSIWRWNWCCNLWCWFLPQWWFRSTWLLVLWLWSQPFSWTLCRVNWYQWIPLDSLSNWSSSTTWKLRKWWWILVTWWIIFEPTEKFQWQIIIFSGSIIQIIQLFNWGDFSTSPPTGIHLSLKDHSDLNLSSSINLAFTTRKH